jgi:hypothetical protein
VLKPATASSFEMESPLSFDSIGERARFIGAGGQGKARRLIWGSQPLERLADR